MDLHIKILMVVNLYALHYVYVRSVFRLFDCLLKHVRTRIMNFSEIESQFYNDLVAKRRVCAHFDFAKRCKNKFAVFALQSINMIVIFVNESVC